MVIYHTGSVILRKVGSDIFCFKRKNAQGLENAEKIWYNHVKIYE